MLNKGQCYPVAEALYHMLGGKAAGWTPQVMRVEGQTHWYLKHKSGFVLDPTASQYTTLTYNGKGCGFLTKQPSKRAKKFMEQLNESVA